MVKSAIILLSGGLDSTGALQMALDQHISVSYALSFDYGQKSAQHEFSAAKRICEHFGLKHRTMKLPFLAAGSKSHPFFNDRVDCPDLAEQDLDKLDKATETAKQVWVPNRNGVFINVAACLADAENIDGVIVGFNKEEAQTFPDNSIEFMKVISESLKYSTQNHVEVISPTVEMNKKEIITYLHKSDFPISLLWSCYHNEAKMCGRCESCQRLKRSLKMTDLWKSHKKLFMDSQKGINHEHEKQAH